LVGTRQILCIGRKGAKMEGKKSFVLYVDLIEMVKELSIDKRGELFTIILEYVNDLAPEISDPLLRVAFTPIKQALKRDLKKWENIVDRNRENGAKGGRPPKEINKPDKPKKPNGLNGNPEEPKKPDSVKVNEKENEKENETSKIGSTRFIQILKSSDYLQDLEQKGFIGQEVIRHIDRFIENSPDKAFTSEAHLKNTFLKFMNTKNRIDYRRSPKRYEKTINEIYTGPLLPGLLKGFQIDSDEWFTVSNDFEKWLRIDSPIIENSDHVFNRLKEYLNKNYNQ
jgi:hypothetical protein